VEQTSILDYGVEIPKYIHTHKRTFNKNHTIKFFEAFAGIGCQRMGLNRINANYEMIGISEIDKYALKSYKAIHGKTKNYGDISKMEEMPYADICTWSFPCQDISLAGKQKGLTEGTRSNYGYDFLDVIERTEKKPKVLIMENVAALFSKKFEKDLHTIYMKLEYMGYKNFTKMLNAKNYGVAQNRDRIFMVSILKTEDDPNPEYEFPIPFKLEKRLKDYLESDVDEKYYLSDKAIKGIRNSNFNVTQRRIQELCARDYKDPKCVQVAEMSGGKWDKMHDIAKRVYGGNGISPTIHTMGGGNLEPKILEEPICLNSKVNGKQPSLQDRVYDTDGTSTAITTSYMPSIAEPIQIDIKHNVKVRKHEVDIDGLKSLLREHKNISNKEIAEKLNQPMTLVEHWFRNDKSFSIPNAEIWFDLKELLGITTAKFDKAITEFEIKENEYDMSNRAYHENGISPTVTSTQEPKIAIPEATNKGYAEAQEGDGVYINRPHQKRGVVQKGMIPTLKTSSDDIGVVDNLRIRKLTPLECWRLMGIDDEDFYKAQAVVSNSQLYKQAGNGIVVDVFAEILKGLIEE